MTEAELQAFELDMPAGVEPVEDWGLPAERPDQGYPGDGVVREGREELPGRITREMLEG